MQPQAFCAAPMTSKGDTLELKVFDFSGITYRETGFANFGYSLIHTVAGSKLHDAPGKGALACVHPGAY